MEVNIEKMTTLTVGVIGGGIFFAFRFSKLKYLKNLER